jgi:hypothetical protein
VNHVLLLLLPGYKVKGHDAAVEAEKVVKISKLPQVSRCVLCLAMLSM